MNKIKYTVITLLFITAINSALFAQARLVLNNDPWIVLNNNVFLVVENSNANAITLAGTGGRIVSEAENNRVRWSIGAATGAYTVPFADNQAEGGTKIPFTFNISAAGVGTGFIDFSTYDGATWDNNTYRPSMVTHMGQLLPPNVANHSAAAIDRFWLVNAQSYTTRPSGTLTFTYIDNEHTAAGNAITESLLGAQRFNNSTNAWGDMLPIVASLDQTNNILVTPTVSAANMFAAWTLSQTNNPLPIKLLSFAANCRDGKALIQWSTASEINNDYFTIEKTFDGINFEFVTKVKGAGNSNNIINYSYIDHNPGSGKVYYRLSQTDFDGTTETFDLISFECGSTTPLDIISVYNNQGGNVISSLSAPSNGKYALSVIDVRGRLIYHDNLNLVEGFNQVSLQMQEPSSGVYFIRLSNESEQIGKKFFIR